MKSDSIIETQKLIIKNIENALNALISFSQKHQILMNDEHSDPYFAAAIDRLDRKYQVERTKLLALESVRKPLGE